MKNTEKKDEDLVKIVQPLVDWYRENKRDLPWRHNPDAYRVWISEIMLQQTRVEAVKGYYDRFLKALPTGKVLDIITVSGICRRQHSRSWLIMKAYFRILMKKFCN